MSALWSSAALTAATHGAWPAGSAAVNGLSIDTRTLQPGDLFVALKDVRDGHEFVGAAFAAGAAAALVDVAHAPGLLRPGVGKLGPLLVADDVLGALEALGKASRARMHGKVIAVTGSVGKTSTKEMLRHVLAPQGLTHASVASYNNHWGVPLTLARMPQQADFGVFEIGMNHSYEILPLTGFVRPDVAIVTTVAPVHLAQFPSLAAIADAKGEIFAGLRHGGVAVINRDIAEYPRLAAHAMAARTGRIVSFGDHEASAARLLKAECGPDGSVVEADVLGQRLRYAIGAPGKHVVMNSLAVLAAVKVAGADVAAAAAALATLALSDGRGKRLRLSVPGGIVTLLDESYNANPSSMRAALQVLGSIPTGPGGRRIAALGDMLELGPTGPALHAELAQAATENGADLVFCAGPLMKNLFDALPEQRRGGYAADSASLEPVLLDAVRAGDIVTVKGSNGSRMARIVAALKARYPDGSGHASETEKA